VAERERDNLSGSKLEAEAFLEKEKNIRRNNNTLYQVYEVKAQGNVEKHADKMAKTQEKLAAEKSKLVESEASHKEMEVTYDSTHSQYSRIEKELQQATSVRFGNWFSSLCVIVSMTLGVWGFRTKGC
jgi:predicted lipoprotein